MTYPTLRRTAQQLSQTVQALARQTAPLTEVATVSNVANHLTLGFVTASVGKGPIIVYGAPAGTLVTGMRIYVQGAGPRHAKRYIFTGYAPAAAVGHTSGAVIVTLPPGTTIPISQAAITLPINQNTGYYWFFFLYVPALPSTTMCLFDWKLSSAAQGIRCLYAPNGIMTLSNYGAGTGTYTSTIPINPHHIWQIGWQLGPGTGNWQALTLNGYGVSIANAPYWTGTVPTWPTAGSYSGSWLNASDGSLPCIPGTWISKLSWGIATQGTTPLTPLAQQANNDALIPNGTSSAGAGVQTLTRYLCAPDVGTTTLHDSGIAGVNATIQPTVCSITTIGPY